MRAKKKTKNIETLLSGHKMRAKTKTGEILFVSRDFFGVAAHSEQREQLQ